MSTWKSVAEIQIDQIIPVVHHLVDHLLVVHQAVVHLRVLVHQVRDHHVRVLLTLLVALHVLIQADLHHDHRDRIQIDDAKIYRRAVVHLPDRVHLAEIAKAAMQMIRVEFAQLQWIAINRVYVQEFLNQIFPKMLRVKNLKKQLAQSY